MFLRLFCGWIVENQRLSLTRLDEIFCQAASANMTTDAAEKSERHRRPGRTPLEQFGGLIVWLHFLW